MATWRDTASAQSQNDLDSLLNVALGFAQQQLATHGEFFPFAAALGTNGETEMIAARPSASTDRPAPADVIASCLDQLITRRHRLRAAAVVSNVRTSASGDAIEVDLEHAEGPTLQVLLPYTKRRLRKGAEFGQLRAQSGTKRVWPG